MLPDGHFIDSLIAASERHKPVCSWEEPEGSIAEGAECSELATVELDGMPYCAKHFKKAVD
jgi:hypothetical protein